MLRLRVASVLGFLMFSGFVADAMAITFADGLVHVIDSTNSFPFEAVVVEDVT